MRIRTNRAIVALFILAVLAAVVALFGGAYTFGGLTRTKSPMCIGYRVYEKPARVIPDSATKAFCFGVLVQ